MSSYHEEEMRARLGNEWYENGVDLSEHGIDLAEEAYYARFDNAGRDVDEINTRVIETTEGQKLEVEVIAIEVEYGKDVSYEELRRIGKKVYAEQLPNTTARNVDGDALSEAMWRYDGIDLPF